LKLLDFERSSKDTSAIFDANPQLRKTAFILGFYVKLDKKSYLNREKKNQIVCFTQPKILRSSTGAPDYFAQSLKKWKLFDELIIYPFNCNPYMERIHQFWSLIKRFHQSMEVTLPPHPSTLTLPPYTHTHTHYW